MTKYEKGKIIKGTVTGIEPYGIFVSFNNYYSGLIHISEISNKFVKNITDFVNIGDVINTYILEVDDNSCQLKLSIKNIKYKNRYGNSKHKIIETGNGFESLRFKLPLWIDKALQKQKNI